jgi:hypothetical protein
VESPDNADVSLDGNIINSRHAREYYQVLYTRYRYVMPELDARIPLHSETRDDLRALKRGQESYDDLLRKMMDNYEPEERR